jgi:G3E family GTPase
MSRTTRRTTMTMRRASLQPSLAFQQGHHHHHDDDVKSFVFRSERAFDPAKLEDFLGAIVNIYGPRMLRYKGVLYMKGTDRKVIFQGVHQLMGSDLGPQWGAMNYAAAKWCLLALICQKTFCCRAWKRQALV